MILCLLSSAKVIHHLVSLQNMNSTAADLQVQPAYFSLPPFAFSTGSLSGCSPPMMRAQVGEAEGAHQETCLRLIALPTLPRFQLDRLVIRQVFSSEGVQIKEPESGARRRAANSGRMFQREPGLTVAAELTHTDV